MITLNNKIYWNNKYLKSNNILKLRNLDIYKSINDNIQLMRIDIHDIIIVIKYHKFHMSIPSSFNK